MAYISSVVRSIEQRFNTKVYGDIQHTRIVSGVRFVDSKDALISYLTPGILYLARFSDYGSYEFAGNILFTGCPKLPAASEALYINEDVDLQELYNVIQGCFQEYHMVQVHKDELFHALYVGKGLEGLLQLAYKHIENPIVVCDSSYNILGSYPPVSDDRNLEIRNNRLAIKDTFSSNMMETNITDHIYHSIYPFITKVEDFEYNWVFESIRINRAVVGYICIRGLERDFTEEDLEIIHALTEMLSIQLQKNDEYYNPYGIKNDLFLKDLFQRHFDDNTAIHKHLSLLGIRPKKYFYIVVCGFYENTGNQLAPTYYSQQLASIFHNSIIGMYGNKFVILATTDSERPRSTSKDSFDTFLKMNHMRASVSYSYDSVEQSHIYFEQALSLLNLRLSSYNENNIFYYSEHYLYHLVELLDKPEYLQASIHPAIKSIRRYDSENNTEYYLTLKAYLENNRSAPATATALHIHKSTLFYRFDKMKALFNIEFDDYKSMFAYEFSVNILNESKK